MSHEFPSPVCFSGCLSIRGFPTSKMASVQQQGPVDFRVLRLSAPVFESTGVPATIDDSDLLSDPFDAATFPVTTNLSLPQVFGTVRVGEVFRALLVVTRTTTSTLRNVQLLAEMSDSQDRRLPKVDLVQEPIPVFPPKSHLDFVISHQVTMPGVHMLSCFISFVENGTNSSMKKFFKFGAAHALSVTVSAGISRTTYEIDLENISENLLCLRKVYGTTLSRPVSLQRGEVYRFLLDKPVVGSVVDVPVEWTGSFNVPGHFTYEKIPVNFKGSSASATTPTTPMVSSAGAYPTGMQSLGSPAIPAGAILRFSGSLPGPLSPTGPGLSPYAVDVVLVEPSPVRAESKFVVRLRIRRVGVSYSPVVLLANPQQGQYNFAVSGPYTYHVGRVAEQAEIAVEFFAEMRGIYRLCPVYLVETETGNQFPFDSLGEVEVV